MVAPARAPGESIDRGKAGFRRFAWRRIHSANSALSPSPGVSCLLLAFPQFWAAFSHR
jgi:hypothetical protein